MRNEFARRLQEKKINLKFIERKEKKMSWKNVIGNIAPTIATALGGPMAGGAVKMLSSILLGKDDGTEEEIAKAVSTATPEQLTKLKEIDAKYKTDMAKIGVDLEQIAADDRDSARKRQVAVQDWVPSVLGIGIMFGFFGILILLLLPNTGFNPGDAKLQIVNIMLGSLGTMAMGVVSYYFGSSTGSKEKNILLKEKK